MSEATARPSIEEALHDRTDLDSVSSTDDDALNLDDVPCGLLVANRDGEVVATNSAWQEMSGLELDESLGLRWIEIFAKREHAAIRDAVELAARQGQGSSREWELTSIDGTPRFFIAQASPRRRASGLSLGCVVSFIEVTSYKAREAELRRRVSHDPLTGLPNRGVLVDRFRRARSSRSYIPGSVAVLFVDLDGFREVNLQIGHSGGDDALRAVAHRFTAVLRPSDTLARVGGDEFALLCEELTETDDAEGVAKRLIAAACEGSGPESTRFDITASVGIAFPRFAGETAEVLLRRADEAMYRAKADGGGRFETA